jgi:hypothetical protein
MFVRSELVTCSTLFPLIVVWPNRRLRSHDIRYGAAEEMLHLTTHSNMTVQEIGQELNHSSAAASIGVIRQYNRKHTTQDTWQERVSLPDKRNIFSNVEFGIEVSLPVSKLKKRKYIQSSDNSKIPLDAEEFVDMFASMGNTRPAEVLWKKKKRTETPDGQTAAAQFDANDTPGPGTPRRTHLIPRMDTLAADGKFKCMLPGCPLDLAFAKEDHMHQHMLKYHKHGFPLQPPVHIRIDVTTQMRES